MLRIIAPAVINIGRNRVTPALTAAVYSPSPGLIRSLAKVTARTLARKRALIKDTFR